MLVIPIDIDIELPRCLMNFVAMQPYISENQLSKTEPFRWISGTIENQIKAIRRTLDLAKNGFGREHASFTLFPEYSIPGLQGVKVIDDTIVASEWESNSVIIAGIDGLSKTEYFRLCNDFHVLVSEQNSPVDVPDGQWINCCIIWVKDKNGIVNKWVQPKICASWPEMNTSFESMFSGSTVYLFQAKYIEDGFPCNFLSLICFDWIAAYKNSTVLEKVISQLDSDAKQSGTIIPLHWVFVIQNNPGPNHTSFLTSTMNFFDNASASFVEIYQAVVIHANTSATLLPSRSGNGAFSACVFSPISPFDCGDCLPTINTHPISLRGKDILQRCKDVVFREMGECIHIFRVCVPKYARIGVNGRTEPMRDSKVYSVTELNDDPRLSGRPIPAALKWFNDTLDNMKSMDISDMENCPLHNDAKIIQSELLLNARLIDGFSATNRINWATCSLTNGIPSRDNDRKRFADLWDQLEIEAMEHFTNSLTLLGLSFQIDISNTDLHGTLKSETSFIQIVAIRGETYSDCIKHYNEEIPKINNDPILLILRNKSNLKITRKEITRYYEQDVNSGIKIMDYQELADCCRNADRKDEIRGYLDGFLSEERKII